MPLEMPSIQSSGGNMLLEIKDLEVFFKSSQGIVKAVNKVNINTREKMTTAIVGIWLR